MGRAHRLDELHPAHHLFDLVGLEVADKVELRAVVGVVLQVGGHLLHPVLAADGHAGGDSLPDGLRALHLGGGHQGDLGGLPARLAGGGGDSFVDLGYALCKGHLNNLLRTL